jgi:hypothetical protein
MRRQPRHSGSVGRLGGAPASGPASPSAADTGRAGGRRFCLCLAALLLVGCGDSTPPPPEPAAVVAEAAETLGAAAADAAKQAESGNYVEAWAGYATLAEKQDLTEEQRAAANRAAVALLPSVSKAAAEGDARAQQLMELYRATK